MDTELRYVLVDWSDHEQDHEYDSLEEAQNAAGDDFAVIAREYRWEFVDSELIWTPGDLDYWPPEPAEEAPMR